MINGYVHTGGVISLARVKSIARQRFAGASSYARLFLVISIFEPETIGIYLQHIKITGPCDYSKCL